MERDLLEHLDVFQRKTMPRWVFHASKQFHDASSGVLTMTLFEPCWKVFERPCEVDRPVLHRLRYQWA